MNQEIIQLLKKYLSNHCNQQELEKVREMIRSGTFKAEWEQVMQDEAAADMSGDTPVIETDFRAGLVWQRVNSTIKPVRKQGIEPWLTGVAAAVLLTLSIGYFFLKPGQPPVSNPVMRLVSAPGRQKKITLSDGTQVTLNCASTLSYTARFNDTKREVYLNGEAFFKVKHDDKKPFLVHSGRLTVQVLGTSFNVRSYPADAKTTVSVASGKVGVNSNKSKGTYMLLPGDQLSYHQQKGFETRKVSLSEILAWQQGIMSFHLETIREIAPVLERYYGVNIVIHTGQSAGKQVTASFKGKTLSEVLEILSQTSDFKYVISKNKVFIN